MKARKAMKLLSLILVTAIIAGMFLISTSSAVTYCSPYDVKYSSDGTMVAVSDLTGAKLVLMNPSNGSVLRTVSLNGEPKGVAWKNSQYVYVAEYRAGTVAEIDAAYGNVVRRFNVGVNAVGVHVDTTGNKLLVTDKGLNKLSIFNLGTGAKITDLNMVYAPEFLDVKSDGTLAVVSNMLPSGDARGATYGADVSFINLSTNTVSGTTRLPQGSTNVRGIEISSNGSYVYVLHDIARAMAGTTQFTRGWMVSHALTIINTSDRTIKATVLLDTLYEGAPNLWGLVESSDGSNLYTTISATDRVAKIAINSLVTALPADATQRANLQYSMKFVRDGGYMTVLKLGGEIPRGIDIYGTDLMVATYYTGKIHKIATATMTQSNEWAVASQPAADSARRGEELYNCADYCLDNWVACSTCHPEGRSDGINWDLLNDGFGNPKNSKSHLFSAFTYPLMSTGIRPNLQACINAGYTVIEYYTPTQQMKDDIEAYLNTLTPDPNPYAPTGTLSADAQAGKTIFTSAGCATCHSGRYTTNLTKYNVGTQHAWDTGVYDNQYDTPTLSELWRSAPYLHDGSAATLMDVLTTYNPSNQHGTTSSLTTTQKNQLVAYLQQLDVDVGAMPTPTASPTPTPSASPTPTGSPTPTPTPTVTPGVGLVAQWLFNNNGNDNSGNGHTATLSGATYSTDAKEGSHSVSYNGTSAYVNVGTFNLGDTFTITMFVKIDGSCSNIQTLMANANGGGSTNGFRYFVNTYQTTDQKVIFETGDGTNSNVANTNTGVATFDAWKHVAVTVNRSAGTAEIFWEGSKITVDNSILNNFNNNATINLGRMLNGQFFFKGLMDDVRIYNRVLGDAEIASMAGPQPTPTASPTPTPTITPTPTTTPTPTPGGNLALGKTTAHSSVDDPGRTSDKAVDGNSTTTRWSSAYTDSEWMWVDLGSSTTVGKVILKWEAAYGSGYKIQTSADATTWTDRYTTTSGDGGTDTITFSQVSTRYVRMLGTARATQWGFSLWEFEIYNN